MTIERLRMAVQGYGEEIKAPPRGQGRLEGGVVLRRPKAQRRIFGYFDLAVELLGGLVMLVIPRDRGGCCI